MNELVILVWVVSMLSIAWATIRELKSNECVVIKAAALVLTVALAPALAIMQGFEQIKH